MTWRSQDLVDSSIQVVAAAAVFVEARIPKVTTIMAPFARIPPVASPSAQSFSVSGRARLQRVPWRAARLMGVVAVIALAAACIGRTTNPTAPTTTTDFQLMLVNFQEGPSSTFDVHLFSYGFAQGFYSVRWAVRAF